MVSNYFDCQQCQPIKKKKERGTKFDSQSRLFYCGLVEQTTQKPATTKRLDLRKPPPVSIEAAVRIAEHRCEGIPLYQALRLECEGWTPSHWHKHLVKRPRLLAVYEKRIAELTRDMVRTIKGTTRASLPVGTCWILERSQAEHFAQNKQAGQLNLTVNTCVGLEDSISKRAAVMVKRWNKKESKTIDVQAETKQIEDKT